MNSNRTGYFCILFNHIWAWIWVTYCKTFPCCVVWSSKDWRFKSRPFYCPTEQI